MSPAVEFGPTKRELPADLVMAPDLMVKIGENAYKHGWKIINELVFKSDNYPTHWLSNIVFIKIFKKDGKLEVAGAIFRSPNNKEGGVEDVVFGRDEFLEGMEKFR